MCAPYDGGMDAGSFTIGADNFGEAWMDCLGDDDLSHHWEVSVQGLTLDEARARAQAHIDSSHVATIEGEARDD